MEVSVDIDVRKTALVKYAAMILGAAHWLGCIWWSLASYYDFNETTWISRYSNTFLSPSLEALNNTTTLEDYIANYGVLSAYSLTGIYEQYLLSYYWGFQSLTNLGYSDLIPDNALEMCFAWFLCVFQVSFYAYILGTLFSYVVKRDDKAEFNRKNLAALQSYCKNRNILRHIYDRLYKYFEFQLSKSDNDNENAQVVKSLPNALLAKVANYKYKEIVLRSHCFHEVPIEFLTSVMELLTTRYLMPNERLFNQGDMSREVCFVERGSLQVFADNDEKTHLRTVSPGNEKDSVMVGEYSFFLNVAQPEMVKSMSNGDVTVLVLSKESYLECLETYPECQSIVVSSLLRDMGLDSKGDDVSNAADTKKNESNAAKDNENGESDSSATDFKEHIQQILKNRSAEALYEMIVAAAEGDGKKVKDLLLQGLDINTHDFDKRTTLHLAAAQGNSKVVQLLLKEGADVHAVDRYGNNPLHEAVSNGHISVAELLGRAGAELNYKTSEHMTKAAGSGDLDKLQMLISYGIDVNSADKDGRSSLHLVSSEGNLNVVEFLLAHEANPNSRDRWGHTPLDGAIEKGHDLVAAALFARGGQMNMKSAKSLFMKSARSGDLGTLKLLTENGIDIDVVDYDHCSALHVAAMADQPVAVDFLLSNKANVNLRSRWSTTPLDEAIKSESILSAKLLLSCGGMICHNHLEHRLAQLKQSGLELPDVRREIATEARLQSERRRDMHKLKQLHIKLVDDIDESNKVLSQQISNQTHIIDKISSSRLSMDLPAFKESDLEFTNLYLELPAFDADTRHIERFLEHDALNNEDGHSLTSTDALSESDSHDANLSVKVASGKFRSEKTGYTMMKFLEQNKANIEAEAPVCSGKESDNNAFNFQTFNQVMLSLPKVEEGLLLFLKTFRQRCSNSEAGTFLIKADELLDCIKLCGGKHVTAHDVQSFVRNVHDYDFDPERDKVDQTLDLELNFNQVLGSEFIINVFSREDDTEKTMGKVQTAFSIIKATFNLLDIDGDGEITPEEIQSQRAIIGDLAYGNELFRSFDANNTVTIGEMVLIFSKWTIFSFGDEQAILEFSISDELSLESNKVFSDVSSLSDNVPQDSLGDQDEGEPHPQRASGPKKMRISLPISPAFSHRTLRRALTPRAWFNKEQDDLNPAIKSRARVDKVTEMITKQSKKQFERYSRSGKMELNKIEFRRMVENLLGETSDSEVDDILEALGVQGMEFISYESLISKNKSKRDESTTSADGLLESQTKINDKDIPFYILLPESRLIQTVKVARTLASVFYLVVIPYECGLIHTLGNSEESRKTLTVGWLVDVILLLDMVTKFHTSYTNKKGFKIVKLSKIRKHYLAHGFVFDLICLFPADILVYVTLTTNTSKLGFFRVCRLLRCIDIISFFSVKLAKATSTARLTVEIQILFVVLFSLLHASACIWFALTDPKTTTAMNTYLSNFHGTFSGFGSNSTSSLRIEEYMLSMYWVTGTLTTMGQGGGDLMPQNATERIFAIFLMMMNLSIYAYILGAISNLFMSADEAIVRKRAEISAVERYITSNRLSSELEKEIRSAMSTDTSSGQGVSLEEERAVFKKLSHSLQVQVSKHTCSSLVDNIPAFRSADYHFKESVCTELTEENFGPGTYVVKKKEPANELFMIASGVVELMTTDEGSGEERVDVDVNVGGVIGEVPFFFNMRHTDSARAAETHVRVFVLTREKYLRLLMLYPDEEEKVSYNILSQIDLQSGNSGAKKKGSGTSVVSDAASSVASSADASSIGGSSVGDSNTGDEGLEDDAGSDTGSQAESRASNRNSGIDRVDTVKRAIEVRSARKRLQVNYAMCLAGGKGEISSLEKAHSAGLNFDECAYFGRTPLHIAASEGQLDVVRFLTPLMETTNVTDNKGNTPLMDAVFYAHVDVAKFLKSVGSTLNEDFASVQLSDACADGDEKKVELLLELGVNPSVNPPGRRRGASRRRRSAAHMAASNNHVGCIKLLIKYWVKLNTFDAWAGTPLADAIRHDHVHMQDVLRKAGGKLKEVGLCTAAAAGDLDTIKLMCDNGADINVTNYIGRTMLHLASSNKQASVIEYLLTFPNLNTSPIDWYGGTPLDDATREMHHSIAVMLKEAGGKGSENESLKASLVAMQSKRIEEKEKAVKSREKEKVLDGKRKKMLIKVSALGHVSIVETSTLRRLWDNLTLSLNGHTWKKEQALEKSPKPTLEEILLFFRTSFVGFMKKKYSLNMLRCYEVMFRFAEMLVERKLNSISMYKKIVTAVYDEYFVESSPHYVCVNHDSILYIANLVKEQDEGIWVKAIGWNHEENVCAKNVYGTICSELRKALIEDFMPAYMKSTEYRAIHRHPSGRTWRVLKMCKKARELCTKIESELANTAEEMTLNNEMNGMYKGSAGFNNLTLEGSRALRNNLQEFKDKTEVIAVIINSWFNKAFKKASILMQNKGNVQGTSVKPSNTLT
mmetsp:Transcript_23103/g.47903  ORF Transcript_23103/g.47903 Transcript_23103/m.47903 type:complete len:2455 (+) Transcript_23103:3757-11121(+)